MKIIFIHIVITLLLNLSANCSKVYDSYLNIYKEIEYFRNNYDDIANTTWKEFFISENVTNLIKCIPSYIDSDRELDLLVLDSELRLYWVSNIRGTSKEVSHHIISNTKLYDFVISNDPNQHNDYILGLNSNRDKILKFNNFNKYSTNTTNQNSTWQESIFLDINDRNLEINSFLENSKISSIHLSDLKSDKKLLLVSLFNNDEYHTSLLKIIIYNEEIDDIALIKFKNNVKIIGAYDMDRDGLIDILYTDVNDNLYVMLNDDPYYFHVFISSLNPVKFRNLYPRIFIIDSDRDGYPDIITADKTVNSVGILFNNGKEYWGRVKKFFLSSKNREEIFKINQWSFIPLFDVYEEGIQDEEIRDFTLFPISDGKRINFQIFTLYQSNMYWFVEKDLKIPNNYWGDHHMIQNYMYCMSKCEIVVETQMIGDNLFDYQLILDINLNDDSYPEFIIYSFKKNSLYWIKKYTPYLTGFGWDPNFWIYIIIYIYIVSSLIGMFEFYRLKKLNDQIVNQKLLLKRDSLESPYST